MLIPETQGESHEFKKRKKESSGKFESTNQQQYMNENNSKSIRQALSARRKDSGA